MLNTRMSAFSARNRARHDGDIKTWGDGEKGEMRMLLTFVDEQYRRAPVEQEGRGECRVTSRSAESVKTGEFSYQTVWTNIKHIMGTGRSSVETSQERPKKFSAGIVTGRWQTTGAARSRAACVPSARSH